MATQTRNKKRTGAKVPALRFPEFSGEWQEKQLGDFLVPTIREVPKPSVPYLALGIRSHFKGTFQRPDSDPQKTDMDMLYSVKEGDLIVNITFAWEGAVAIAKKEDTGGLVSYRFPTYTFNDDVVTRDFFRFVFPRERMKYDLVSISPGGAGRNRVLSKKDFLKLKTWVPVVKEQQKIAEFLRVVDGKIEVLSKKKEVLEKYKKGTMQKIFSQEIRFKVEDGNLYPDWEEKDFSEVFYVIPSKKYQIKSLEICNEGSYPVVDQSPDTISGYSEKTEKLFKNIPVIIFGDHTTAVKYIDFDFVIGADGTKVLKNSSGVLKYLYYCLLFNNVEQEGYKRHFSILKKLRFQWSEDAEQQKIADFLTSLDEKISAIGSELNHAKAFKKGLLQQMFV